MISLERLINESERIGPVPKMIRQLVALAEDPDVPISEVTELILYEPLITANLLKVANSAAFGFKKKIESVHDAVVLLGFKRVVELAILAGVTGSFRLAYDGYGLEKGQLWKQSVSCALMAGAVAEAVDPSFKHVVFTAALLKDIGVVIMDPHMKKVSAQIRNIMKTDHLDLVAAERAVLGIDHARLGGEIVNHWHFSDTQVSAIQDHHLADTVESIKTETAMVYLADSMCSFTGINSALFCGQYIHYDRVLKHLHLDESAVNQMMSHFYAQKDSIYGVLTLL